MTPINTSSITQPEKPIPTTFKRVILVALAALMAVGLLISGLLNAHWFIPLIFFTLALGFLFPLTQRVDAQKDIYLCNAP